MTNPKSQTIKQLFGLSGNICCFPKCTVNLIDKTSNQVIGEVCHIKAKNPLGLRYDINQSDSERNAFDNLILMCPTHHSVIDSDEESYTVERLVKMKKDHESKFKVREDISDELVEKLLIKNEGIIYAETTVKNAVNSQFANIIQNINTSLEGPIETTYDHLLEKIHSGTETLSKTLSETLRIAKFNGDSDLMQLCISELSGWESPSIPVAQYRFQQVFLSTYIIASVTNLSMYEFWRDLKNKPDQFVLKKMFFTNSVPDIESIIDSNKFLDPSKSFIHLVKKQKDLFPSLDNPDLDINIYCQGTLYHDLLKGIRINLSAEIIKKIK